MKSTRKAKQNMVEMSFLDIYLNIAYGIQEDPSDAKECAIMDAQKEDHSLPLLGMVLWVRQTEPAGTPFRTMCACCSPWTTGTAGTWLILNIND